MLINNIIKTNFDFVEAETTDGTYPETALFIDSGADNDIKTYSNLESVEADFPDGEEYDFAKLYFDNGGAKLTIVSKGDTTDPVDRLKDFVEEVDLKDIVFFAFTNIEDSDIPNIDEYVKDLESPDKLIGVFHTDSKSSELTDGLSDYSVVFFNEKAQSHALIPAYFSDIKTDRADTLRNVEYYQVNDDGDSFSDYVYKSDDYDNLVDKNYNFLINITDDTVIAGGVTATGIQIGTVFATTTIQREIQNSIFRLFASERPFLTTEGVSQVRSVITPVLERYRDNGAIGGFNDVWNYPTQEVEYNGDSFRPITRGEVLGKGYKLFIPTNISDEDISNKQLPPIYIYLIMQGNIRTIEIKGKVGA